MTVFWWNLFWVSGLCQTELGSYPTATLVQVWGEQLRQKMVRGSGKKLLVSPVWNQWHTTMPFSSPDTTKFLSTGDQCSAETGLWEDKGVLVLFVCLMHGFPFAFCNKLVRNGAGVEKWLGTLEMCCVVCPPCGGETVPVLKSSEGLLSLKPICLTANDCYSLRTAKAPSVWRWADAFWEDS